MAGENEASGGNDGGAVNENAGENGGQEGAAENGAGSGDEEGGAPDTRIPVEYNGKTYLMSPEQASRYAKMGMDSTRQSARRNADDVSARELRTALKSPNARNALIAELGQDEFKKLAIDYIAEVAEEEELREKNPKEWQRRQAQKVKDEETNKLKAENDKLRKGHQSNLERQKEAQFDREITDALKDSKMPRNAHTMNRICDLLEKNLNMDDPLPTSEIVKMVEEEWESGDGDKYKGLPVERMLERALHLFGADGLKAIQRVNVDAIKKAPTAPLRSGAGGQRANKGQDGNKRKEVSHDDFKAYMEKVKRGEA